MKIEIGYFQDTRLDIAHVHAESIAVALCEFVESTGIASKRVAYIRNTEYPIAIHP